MPFEPWVGGIRMNTRHCFAEAAYWFVAGVMWQADLWSVRWWRVRLLPRILGFCAWHLDDLRMTISGHCYPDAPYRSERRA